MKAKLKVLTLKATTAGYGTDPTPTAAANVVLAYNVDINPLAMETDDHMPVSDQFGALEKIIGSRWSTISFDVMLCGGGLPLGTSGTVPNHDVVLRAAGFARTINSGVSTFYNQVSVNEEDAAIYYWNNGIKFKMLGVRGSLSWSFPPKKAAVLTFKGIGLHSPATDQTMPTATLPTPPKPVAVNHTNTYIVVDGSYALPVASLTLEQGNDVQFIERTGQQSVMIVDRSNSGKVTFEMPLVAEKDFIGANGICTLGTTVAFNISHGQDTGNAITYGLTVQLLNPKPRAEGGISMLDCDMHVVRNQLSVDYR